MLYLSLCTEEWNKQHDWTQEIHPRPDFVFPICLSSLWTSILSLTLVNKPKMQHSLCLNKSSFVIMTDSVPLSPALLNLTCGRFYRPQSKSPNNLSATVLSLLSDRQLWTHMPLPALLMSLYFDPWHRCPPRMSPYLTNYVCGPGSLSERISPLCGQLDLWSG